MGRRDFSSREAKKPKKDAKKLPAVSIVAPPVEVEVVRKRKKREDEVEEQ